MSSLWTGKKIIQCSKHLYSKHEEKKKKHHPISISCKNTFRVFFLKNNFSSVIELHCIFQVCTHSRSPWHKWNWTSTVLCPLSDPPSYTQSTFWVSVDRYEHCQLSHCDAPDNWTKSYLQATDHFQILVSSNLKVFVTKHLGLYTIHPFPPQ